MHNFDYIDQGEQGLFPSLNGVILLLLLLFLGGNTLIRTHQNATKVCKLSGSPEFFVKVDGEEGVTEMPSRLKG